MARIIIHNVMLKIQLFNNDILRMGMVWCMTRAYVLNSYYYFVDDQRGYL